VGHPSFDGTGLYLYNPLGDPKSVTVSKKKIARGVRGVPGRLRSDGPYVGRSMTEIRDVRSLFSRSWHFPPILPV